MAMLSDEDVNRILHLQHSLQKLSDNLRDEKLSKEQCLHDLQEIIVFLMEIDIEPFYQKMIGNLKKQAIAMLKSLVHLEKKKSADNAKKSVAIEEYKCLPQSEGLHHIAGMDQQLQHIRTMFILPIMQPQLYTNCPVYKTLLLYGPPGCGKTQLVHSLAAELAADLYCISAGNVLSSLVGQSERNILNVFTHIGQVNSTTIFFIDEIDTFCRTRKDNESDHNRRVKTEFMNQLTATPSDSKAIIVAATNVPWDIDSAIMRRFQKQIYIGLPDKNQRRDVLLHFLKSVEFSKAVNDVCSWDMLLDITDGYSISDLQELVRAALHKPIDELHHVQLWTQIGDMYTPSDILTGHASRNCSLYELPANSIQMRDPCLNDLMSSIKDVRRTVSDTDMKKFSQFLAHDTNKP